MTSSQRFGRFVIPFRVPLLFSPRMARVTAAEISSREGKRCPRMGSFNLWNKSKSGGLMSGLYGAWGNIPTRIYLANRSHSSPGAGVHCRAKWVAHPQASQVGFYAFFCQIFASSHDSTLLSHLFHMEICHDESSVIISKDHDLLDLWLRSSKLFGSKGSWTSPLVWLRFQLRFKVSNPRFVNSDISIQECLTFNLNLCFNDVAISRRFCFCSAVKQRGIHRAQIFLISKPFVKIRNTDGENQVACDTCISSHVARRSCGSKSATSFTLRSSVDVFGLPGFW